MALDFELLCATSSDGSSQWDCRESAVVTQFLNRTDGLEEVVVNSLDSVKFDGIRDSFLKNLDRTLRKLYASHTATAARA
jgi:hypothetical protein